MAGWGGRRGGGPVCRRRDDRSVRRPRNVRDRDPALRRPEGVGLRRARLRHRRRPTSRRGSRPAGGRSLRTIPTSWCSPSPASTHRDSSLHTFDDFYERRLRHRKGLVVLAPAGNDAWSHRMWPAAHQGVIARRRAGRELARPGALHQLRPVGRCLRAWRKPRQTPSPRAPTCAASRPTSGKSGSSTAWQRGADVVQHPAGGRADRGPDVADRAERPASLGLAAAVRRQPVDPGVGPVLYPGQADCEPGH